MFKKKLISLSLSLVLIIAMISGCSLSKNESNGSGLKVFLDTTNSKDTFQAGYVAAAQTSAKDAGIDLTVEYAEKNVDTQIQQIQQAATDGYDVIICNPVDATTALQIEAITNNIPVIFISTHPESNLLKKGKYVFVGSDEHQAGNFQAKYALSKLSSKSEINAVIFMGAKGHSGAIGRTEAVKSALKASGKKINYTFVDYGKWNTDITANMFDLFLKTGQKVDVVFCNNDSMALGVVKSMKANNIDPESIPVLGVDATADGCNAVKDKSMAFTVFQNAAGQANAAMQVAKALAGDGDLSKIKYVAKDELNVYVPFEKVDSSNVSNYIK